MSQNKKQCGSRNSKLKHIKRTKNAGGFLTIAMVNIHKILCK